jgi:hypothetical protein
MPLFDVTLIHRRDRYPATQDLIGSERRPLPRREHLRIVATTLSEAVAQATRRWPEYVFERAEEISG